MITSQVIIKSFLNGNDDLIRPSSNENMYLIGKWVFLQSQDGNLLKKFNTKYIKEVIFDGSENCDIDISKYI